MADLQAHGIAFTPSTHFFGTVTALFPPDLYPMPFLTYERRSAEGTLIDTLLLHSTQSFTQTQQVETAILRYAANEYGLRGVDLAGPVRYYTCGDLIAVYQAIWQTGIDPAVDETLAAHCAPAFVRYPLE